MRQEPLQLFALSESRGLAEGIAAHLGVPLAGLEERTFDDGEHSVRPRPEVSGRHCVVIQSLYAEPDRGVSDKLCRLLFLVAALKDAAVQRVTAMLPYLCYARADRRTAHQGPLTLRYLAELLEAVGVDRVIALDVHNLAAFHNAFRCPVDQLEAAALFVDRFAPRLASKRVVVVSPDAGGMKRAERLRELLSQSLGDEVSLAFLAKRRAHDPRHGEELVGNVQNRAVLIIDDLISTGETLARAARACREGGAHTVLAAATHGLFAGAAARTLLQEGLLDELAVTNSVRPPHLPGDGAANRLAVLDASPILAKGLLAHRES
jgi:ribose-phosphate pyrophosphokinase